MRAVFFLNSMSCCLSLGLGLYALFRRPRPSRPWRSALETAFAALCFVIAAGSFGGAFFASAASAAEAERWFHAFAFAWYLSPPLFLLFSLLLSGIRLPVRLAALIFLPGSLVLVAHVLNPNAVLASVARVPLGWHAVYAEERSWHWFNVFNYSACALAAMGVLVRATRASEERRVRVRAGIVLFSIIPAFFGTFVTGFLIRYFGVETLPPMMPLFLSILIVGLAVALFRYDLLELTATAAADRILASVRDAVALVSADGTVIESNLSSLARGYRGKDEIRGADVGTLLPASTGAAWLAERAAANAKSFESDFAFAPGRISPASVTVRAVNGPDGGPLGYIVSAHDLTAEKGLAEELGRRIAATTALRSMEERFARAFRASPAGMLIVEGDTRVVLDANEAAARVFGKETAGIVGRCTDDLGFFVAPEDLNPLLERLDRGEATGVREFTVVRVDGERVRCLVAASPLEFGGKQAVVFSLVDVTELNRLRDAVARTQKLDSIGMLAGGLAHDFNNILTAVMGNLGLARLSIDVRSEVLEAIDRSEAACWRARDLAGQLLTFSKGGDPSPEPADVLLLLREAVRMATAGSSVAAVFSNDSNLPLAFVDPGQIMQAFNNIALNAVQAMSEGGTLFLRTRLVVAEESADLPDEDPSLELAPGRYVAIDFRDEGPGIPNELLERIFDPYVTTKRKGSGLGLAICYSILKRHHGAVTAASEPGRGARFTVYLPAAESVGEGGRPGRDANAGRGRPTPTFGRGSILLMDDDLAIRSTSERLLVKLGYEPTMCVSGDTAVETFAAARAGGHPFSAVILDLTVPAGMGGIEAARLIREMDSAVPIFVSSGYAEAPVLSDYAAYGFDGVIPKPYGIEELGRKLAGA